ncbi:MAG: HD domain-containing protein [Candidatus Pacebacteria bacterium]|nr:HD domain-containing protein [Candidatus Paceibacterota bacterium]
MKSDVIVDTETFVRSTLDKDGTGHDWWHCVRVRNTAVKLAHEEGAEVRIVELSALLHDIADHKFHGGDKEVGPRIAKEFLEAQGVEREVVEHVANIIRHMSWSTSKEGNRAFDSLEMRIVQDADRLDAIGAIGIARCFAYSGHAGRPLYDPTTDGEYNTSALQHFQDKLFKIRDSLHTASARNIAQERHVYMKEYVARFHDEWGGIV